MSVAVVDCAVEIRRSPEDVFDYVTDISREFEWNPRTKRVAKLTDVRGFKMPVRFVAWRVSELLLG